MTDDTSGPSDRPTGQRAKYERVLGAFARGEAVRLDAPSDGGAVYLATYSGLTHVWFADDAPRPDVNHGPKTTHFAYRASLAVEDTDEDSLDMSGFAPWIRALVLLVEPDDIEGVSLLDSPFIDADADTESGIGFRDPHPTNIYEMNDGNSDSDTDHDHDLTGLS